MSLEFFANLKAIHELLRSFTDRIKNSEHDAYLALNSAISQTERVLYHATTNIDPNFELERVWNSAALEFRKAGNPDLQRLCTLKGSYWYNPGDWSEEQIQQNGIKLRAMREILREKLYS